MKSVLFIILSLVIGCASKKVVTDKANYSQWAQHYFDRENHSRARFYYQAALAKNQGDKGHNLSQLGILSIKLNQYEEAKNYFNQSYELKKTDGTLYNLALCHLLLNQPQKAIEQLNQLMAQKPDDHEVTKLLIIASLQVENYTKSFELFEQLPASIRKNGDIHPYYVYTLIKLDKLEEADFQMINVKDLQVAKRIMKILKPRLASK